MPPEVRGATRPEKLIEYTELEVDGTLIENVDGYAADQEIAFGMGDKYTKADGIVTFRGIISGIRLRLEQQI